MNQNFCNQLKKRREELNMTQTELAHAANLTPAAISQFESGTRKPSYDTMETLSYALRVTIDYLYGKKEYDSDDLLVDHRIAGMLEGMLNFSEKDKETLLEIYELVRLRVEAPSRNSSNRASASLR
ncbi:MAG: helix-turn-helix transcriptional regulator [Candidatus Poribacteria bacterium]|nr:helix-turn-helix transcriptional regulator [Candidatus Poribacteria bacterium]